MALVLERHSGHTVPDGLGEDLMESSSGAAVWTLSAEECWNLLARRELGRLAVAVDAQPDIFPVNYVTDGPHILFRTALGSKLSDLTASPRVAFEVDEYDDETAASVVVKGIAKRIELQSEIDDADALPLTPWVPTLKYHWVRISLGTISGVRFARTPEPPRYSASMK